MIKKKLSKLKKVLAFAKAMRVRGEFVSQIYKNITSLEDQRRQLRQKKHSLISIPEFHKGEDDSDGSSLAQSKLSAASFSD
jgi:hypothetical protein